MPFLRQQLRVDPVGHEDAVRPRLRAAAFDQREPLTRRGRLRSRRCSGLAQRLASESGTFTADSHRRACIVVEHVLAPELAASADSPRCSVRLRRSPVRQVTERAPADSRPQLDSMLMEALGPRLLLWQASTPFI
jgi:hypothetical protein